MSIEELKDCTQDCIHLSAVGIHGKVIPLRSISLSRRLIVDSGTKILLQMFHYPALERGEREFDNPATIRHHASPYNTPRFSFVIFWPSSATSRHRIASHSRLFHHFNWPRCETDVNWRRNIISDCTSRNVEYIIKFREKLAL